MEGTREPPLVVVFAPAGVDVVGPWLAPPVVTAVVPPPALLAVGLWEAPLVVEPRDVPLVVGPWAVPLVLGPWDVLPLGTWLALPAPGVLLVVLLAGLDWVAAGFAAADELFLLSSALVLGHIAMRNTKPIVK